MDRKSFLRVGSAALLGTLAGCGGGQGGGSQGAGTSAAGAGAGKPVRGGTARLMIGDMVNFTKLEPATVGGGFGSSQLAYSAMYNGLVRTDGKLGVHPELATEWSISKDAKRWSCKLADGVTFHDGRPLTSADVVFSLKRVFDPKVGSPALASLAPFLSPKGIAAPDAKTVVLSLEQPNAFFSQMMTSGYLRISPEGTRDFSEAIGTGPFRLGNFAPGVSLEMARYDEYFRSGRPYLDGVELVANDDPAQRLQAVLTGDVDMADAPPASSYPALERSSVADLLLLKGTLGLYSAGQRDQKPFDDPRVVQAIKHATDRERLNSVLLGGKGVVNADVPVPSTDAFYPDDLAPLPHDPERAKALLKQAGYGDGLQLELFTSAGPRLDLATTFAAVVKDAGIEMKVNNWPRDSYWEQVWKQRPFFTSSVGHDPFIITIADHYVPGGTFNETNAADPRVRRMLNEMASTLDESRQRELAGEILRDVNAAGTDFLPAFGGFSFAAKKRLTDVQLAGGVTYVLLDDAYIAA